MNGISFETSLYTRLKFTRPTKKLFAASEYLIEISACQTIKHTIKSKKYQVKNAFSRNRGMLFYSTKKYGYFNWNSSNSFKKLTREVLCDIPKIPKERHNMCLRGLDIHRRASLNVQRVLFSVLCWHFTEPSPVNWRCPQTIQDNTRTVIPWEKNCDKFI